jgi:cyclopropane fatty-acyl-phospholipid synthase-like methyltransferase
MDAARELHRLANGYQVSQAISVAARLGISDVLAAQPQSLTDLAASTGTAEDALARLMHALVELGLYTADGGVLANTELGAAMCVDASPSIAGWVRFIGTGSHWQAYAGLEQTLRTGETTFSLVHGEPVWEYRAKHPDEQRAFDAAMTANADAASDAVVAAYDFGRHQRVVDVGGGQGRLLLRILDRYPGVSGVLFDQADVVSAADSTRFEVVGGNFFEHVPTGDVLVLKSIIHDWADAEAVAVLRTCAKALPPNGRLLLVEQLLDRSPDPVRTAFSDLNMLIMTGGRERTVAEYTRLLADAGLTLTSTIPTSGSTFILEAR